MMLKERDSAQGQRTDLIAPDDEVKTLADMGITNDQSAKWQRLANVPESDFEDALADPEKKPSTTALIRKMNGSNTKMDDDALWIWGRLRDMERRNLFERHPDELVGTVAAWSWSRNTAISPSSGGRYSPTRRPLNATNEINDLDS